MSLSPGTMLDSCEVLGLIGKGGMGEVYRGRDTKLGRHVAIKALPAIFTQDQDRILRFQREAQILAALNHPNIAIIHELKEVHSARYLILELVEGETLADRIAAGPIPVEDALVFAAQMADDLSAAHEKGIVHRDLKPANVKITPEGRLKVLDFGLAKNNDPASGSYEASNSPTLTAMQTAGGVIMGTVAYMSPEQARGKPLDRRSDVWSFGAVFYEMLTGRQAFPNGETVSDTLASSRNTAVNVAQQNIAGGNLYAAAFGVVPREQRLSTSTSGQVPTDWSRDGRYLIYKSDGDIWALPMSGGQEPLRITETLFEESNARVSPNGRWIAYDSPKSGTQTDVFIRSFPEPGIEVQASANGGSDPRWSPDGSEVYYLSPLPDSQLMAVSVKESGSGLQFAAPVALFPARLPSLEEFRSYDVASGGRFLMNLATTDQTVLPITVIHNWAAGLRK